MMTGWQFFLFLLVFVWDGVFIYMLIALPKNHLGQPTNKTGAIISAWCVLGLIVLACFIASLDVHDASQLSGAFFQNKRPQKQPLTYSITLIERGFFFGEMRCSSSQ